MTVPGETVERHHVVIMSPLNLPATMPVHASQMYAKNLTNLMELFLAKDGSFALNLDDDIVAATCIAHNGEILHGPTRGKLGLGDRNAAPAAAVSAPAVVAPNDAPQTSDSDTIPATPVPEENEETISLATATEADLDDPADEASLPDIAETDDELDLDWAPDVDERAASDAAGFVPPVSIGDTLPASREMLDQAVRDIEDEIASNDEDLPTDETPWRPRTE